MKASTLRRIELLGSTVFSVATIYDLMADRTAAACFHTGLVLLFVAMWVGGKEAAASVSLPSLYRDLRASGWRLSFTEKACGLLGITLCIAALGLGYFEQ
jgi:hypothetical protein